MIKRALLLIICLPLFASCSKMGDCTEGNGIVTAIDRSTEPFQEVVAEGSMQVILQRGTNHAIRIEADSNLHQLLRAKVKKGELTLTLNGCVKNASPMRVYLTAPMYKSLEIDGSGSISSEELLSTEEELKLSVEGSGRIDLNVHAKKLTAEIDGSGTINLKGATEGQVVEVEGSGKYLAFDLRAKETVVSLSGSGEVEVTTDAALTVDHRGSGTVRYRGAPGKINSNVKGSGRLVQEQ